MRPSTIVDRLSTRSLGLVGLAALMALAVGASGHAMSASFSVAEVERYAFWRSWAFAYLLLTVVSAGIALGSVSLLAWRQVARRGARSAAGEAR